MEAMNTSKTSRTWKARTFGSISQKREKKSATDVEKSSLSAAHQGFPQANKPSEGEFPTA
jgi:hypothetical protein